MDQLLEKIAECLEIGKANQQSPFPPDMIGEKGVDELTKEALDQGISPGVLLDEVLIKAMQKVGKKFGEGKIFIPELLMAALAMKAAMVHIKPYYQSGNVEPKGTLVIGTIFGDLHDIGKNLVAMMVESNGWLVVDLGVDTTVEKMLQAIEQNPGCILGMSALLTTTMVNMETAVKAIREKYPDQKIMVGGAPLNQEYCDQIGASFYSSDPQGAVGYLSQLTE